MEIQYSPQLTSLLPLFYVGWADAVLGPSEIALIEAKLHDAQWLTEKDKELLSSWSNPLDPPSDELIASWAAAIHQAARSWTKEEDRISLAKLGLEMARTQQEDGNDLDWLSEEVLKVLTDIEMALNINGLEQHTELFTDLQLELERKVVIEKAAFNKESLQEILDDDYTDIRKEVFTLLKDPMFNYQTIRNKEDYREHVLDWLKLLADQGLGAMHFPEEYGGNGDMGSYSAVFETLGYHDLSLAIKFGVQFGLFGGAVLNLGTKKHHQLYLEKIGNMQLPGCFAMTELGHGSNVRDLETTATYDPLKDELIIHSPTESAGKDYIGNAAAHAKMAAVFAQLIVKGENHGVHAILVPLRDDEGETLEGIRIEDCDYKLGLNGVDNGRIWFDQVRVPRFNLLNRFGNIDEHGHYDSPIEKSSKRFFTMLGTLVGGRVCVPRAGLSAAKTALTIAVRYALKRRQFGEEGKPEMLIMDYPTHQRRLMPLLAKSYALDFALTDLTKDFVNSGEDRMRELETNAAAMKSVATWFSTHCIQECREACGGKGYLAENRFADLKADSDIFTTFEGDNTVLMQLVAKGVLHEFKTEFSEGGMWGMLEFVADRFLTVAREKNPFAIRNTNEKHLRGHDFHLHAFRYREEELTISVAGRLRKYVKRGISGHQAFLRCQTHLMELAHAYADRWILESFVNQVETCADETIQNVLSRLCSLYALHTIETHKGWYLEQDYMEGMKSKAIRKQVDKLCQEVRADSRALVDAFGIPEDCLAAPIAVYS